jgi:hypothetical protein
MQVVTYRHSASGAGAAQELGRQANEITIYLFQSGHVLWDDFRDIGKPGEGLTAAIDALATGPAEGLLVTSLDQIGGTITDVRSVRLALRNIGAALVTISDGIISA